MILDDLTNLQIITALQACAKLESQLTDAEDLRSYQFSHNGEGGVAIAIYDNGAGDHLVVVIDNGAILVKGFDHESDVSPYAREDEAIWPGMYEGAPAYLLKLLDEPFVDDEDIGGKYQVTFCFWRESNEGDWQQGPVEFSNKEDDGSDWLLDNIITNADDFMEWGEDYYGDEFEALDEADIRQAFGGIE